MRLRRANRDYLNVLPLTFFSSEEDISNLTYISSGDLEEINNSETQISNILRSDIKSKKKKFKMRLFRVH